MNKNNKLKLLLYIVGLLPALFMLFLPQFKLDIIILWLIYSVILWIVINISINLYIKNLKNE
jgi:hypothetical protein